MKNVSETSARVWLTSLVVVLPLLGLSAQAQNSLTNGLVAYWNFDNQDFKDAVGKFDGTGHGTKPIAFVPGKSGFGQAIQLDGVDEFIEITGRDETYQADDPAMAGGSISIAGWFSVASFDKSWQALIAKGTGHSWRVHRNEANSTMAYAGGADEGPNDGPDVSDGNWHHFVAVSDAEAVNFGTCLYIDGIPTSINQNVPILDAADPFYSEGQPHVNTRIGDNPRDTGRNWNGQVDDLAIWSRVLAENEINALYSKGTGQPVSTFLVRQPTLVIVRSGNLLTISWSPTGGTLEFTSVLGPAATWTALGAANPAPVQIGTGGGFYRVRQ